VRASATLASATVQNILQSCRKVRVSNFTSISLAASTLADTEGLRAGCSSIIDIVSNDISSRIAFVALGRGDSSVADIVAADGLGAADFRRLEARITKSTVWQIFRLGKPVAIDDVSNDMALEHLAFSCGTRFLVAVPIVLKGTTVGLIAAGFPSAARTDENAVIHFLQVIAALIAQAMRTEQVIADESRKLAEENIHLKQELKSKYDFGQIIGNSSQMRQIYDQVSQVSRSNVTVLLRGESGTGKELIANAIHYNSLRSKRPLVKINCSAVPPAMLEAELFGYEKGAIDGAVQRKKGLVETADGGTLFIDEIDDLTIGAQQKLAEILETQTYKRLGGTESLRANVRLIAATAKDVEAPGAAFDSELLAAMTSFTIFLPPLRERKSDILLLADHFLQKYSSEHDKAILRISTPAIDMLTAYHFPGNVRELENVIERAVIACDSNVIHGHHLPPTLQTAEVSDTVTQLTLASAVEAFESDLIQDALKSSRGNVARAAKMLDSTERILGYKIKKYEIDPTRFKKWTRSNI